MGAATVSRTVAAVGRRVEGRHLHGGRRHFGVLRDGQREVGHETRQRDDDGDHGARKMGRSMKKRENTGYDLLFSACGFAARVQSLHARREPARGNTINYSAQPLLHAPMRELPLSDSATKAPTIAAHGMHKNVEPGQMQISGGRPQEAAA